MGEKKPMTVGELEDLIQGDLCSYDESIRLEARAKLLEDGSEMVGQQLAQKTNYEGLSYPKFMIDTLMLLPLTVRLRGLLFMASSSGSTHIYQGVAKKALREAIEIFKENKDTKSLWRIHKSSATGDIIELASRALAELGELEMESRPILIVDSLRDLTIKDNWGQCNVNISRTTLLFTANFYVETEMIQTVRIKGKTQALVEEELDYIVSQGFKQTGGREDSKFVYCLYKRESE